MNGPEREIGLLEGHVHERELLEHVSGADWGGDRLADVGLTRLSRWTCARIELEAGLSPAAARRLWAAFELGRRVELGRLPERARLASPRGVWECVMPGLRGLERETFLVLLLDGKHRLQQMERISEGTLNSSIVHPREVFRSAVRAGAGALIVAHNHPSGDPEPSPEDVAVTRRLVEAGELLGIPLLDHVVVADASYVSLRERMGFGLERPLS